MNKTETKPLISIITVVLNGKEELKETINSIRLQDERNFEFIVVDGGSTDGTLEVIDENKDIVNHFVSELDAGISDAFNKGIKLSTGEWINFLNAGDIYSTDKTLSLISEILVNKQTPIITGFAKFGKKTIPKRKISNSEPIWVKSLISHQASFVRKNIFSKYGMFDCDYKIRMDYEFWLRVLKYECFEFLPLEIINYLPGGISGSDILRFNIEEIMANKKNTIPYRKIANIRPLLKIFLRF